MTGCIDTTIQAARLVSLIGWLAAGAGTALACEGRASTPSFQKPPAAFVDLPVVNPRPDRLTLSGTLGVELELPAPKVWSFPFPAIGLANAPTSEWLAEGKFNLLFAPPEPLVRVGGFDGAPFRPQAGNAGLPQSAPVGGAFGPSALEHAVVLVHGMSPVNSSIAVGTCNGVFIGNNRVLTSRHCVGSKDSLFIVEFGKLELPAGAAPKPINLRGEERCPARVYYYPDDGPGSLHLDYAVIALDQTPGESFLAGALTLERDAVWSSPAYDIPQIPPTGVPALPAGAKQLALAQVWLPGASERAGVFGEKTLEPAGPDTTTSHCFSAIRSGAENDACVTDDMWRSGISPDGDPNGCDAVQGSSGAPLFWREKLATPTRPKIVGIVKSGNKSAAAWNCAVSSARICKDLSDRAQSSRDQSAQARSLVGSICTSNQ